MSTVTGLRRHLASLSATLHISDVTPGVISIDLILVAAELRGRGCARRALEVVIAWADEAQVTVLLTATPAFGASVARLVRLYSSFGFTPTAKDGLGGTDMMRRPAAR